MTLRACLNSFHVVGMRFGGVQRTGPQLKGEPWRLNGEMKFWGFSMYEYVVLLGMQDGMLSHTFTSTIESK